MGAETNRKEFAPGILNPLVHSVNADDWGLSLPLSELALHLSAIRSPRAGSSTSNRSITALRSRPPVIAG
jgi:hypothetical protein